MTRYIGKRLTLVPVQLFGVSIVTFVLIRLIPGNPAQAMAGPLGTPTVIAALARRLGLDKPIWDQYGLYLKHLLTLNLGNSFATGKPVLSSIGERLPATLELITCSLIVALVVGIALATISVLRPGHVGDRISYSYAMIAGAIPDFWLGLMLVYFLFFKLGWLPAPDGQLAAGVKPPQTVTGFVPIDSLLAGDFSAFLSACTHLILPVLTLAGVYTGMVVKMTRSRLREVIDSDYILYARACGLSAFSVWRYAIRNALPAIVTQAGMMYSFLLGGAVLVEQIFSWGGIGQYAVSAVGQLDYAALQGIILTAAAFNLVVFLGVDVIERVIDPRLRERVL